jgi:hypothetical protein
MKIIERILKMNELLDLLIASKGKNQEKILNQIRRVAR